MCRCLFVSLQHVLVTKPHSSFDPVGVHGAAAAIRDCLHWQRSSIPRIPRYPRSWSHSLSVAWNSSLHFLLLSCPDRVPSQKSANLLLCSVSIADGGWCRRSSVGLRHRTEPPVALRNILRIALDLCLVRNR